jgi:hypothetical protein
LENYERKTKEEEKTERRKETHKEKGRSIDV